MMNNCERQHGLKRLGFLVVHCRLGGVSGCAMSSIGDGPKVTCVCFMLHRIL